MKKLVSEPKNCLKTLITLMFLIEFMLMINNKFIQTIGILFTPVLVFVGVLLIRFDNKNIVK